MSTYWKIFKTAWFGSGSWTRTRIRCGWRSHSGRGRHASSGIRAPCYHNCSKLLVFWKSENIRISGINRFILSRIDDNHLETHNLRSDLLIKHWRKGCSYVVCTNGKGSCRDSCYGPVDMHGGRNDYIPWASIAIYNRKGEG